MLVSSLPRRTEISLNHIAQHHDGPLCAELARHPIRGPNGVLESGGRAQRPSVGGVPRVDLEEVVRLVA